MGKSVLSFWCVVRLLGWSRLPGIVWCFSPPAAVSECSTAAYARCWILFSAVLYLVGGDEGVVEQKKSGEW